MHLRIIPNTVHGRVNLCTFQIILSFHWGNREGANTLSQHTSEHFLKVPAVESSNFGGKEGQFCSLKGLTPNWQVIETVIFIICISSQ